MKRKNITAIKKAKDNKLLIQNYKNSDFYKKFKSKIYKKIKKNNFAVAVSGGSDSLCLAYFSKVYSSELRNKIHYLIVDHNLRKESRKESTKVKKILKTQKIQGKILTWKGKLPKSNIQKNARNIRYSLISSYCIKRKIKFLVTAHHKDDQIENFLIRLLRGSGITGLSSMSEITSNFNLRILRPFLSFEKKYLKQVTVNVFKTFIDDPSNDNDKFLRVRVRKYRKVMKKEGLDTNKISKTIDNITSANKALDFYKKKAIYKHVSFMSKNNCLINKQLFLLEADEIIFKSFSDILSLISGTYYPPRSKKILYLIDGIKKNNIKKSTLGGCIIENRENDIFVSRETKAKQASYRA